MTPEIIEMPPMRVAAVRHVGPYHELQSAFQRLGEIAGQAGLFGLEGMMVMGVYHDTLTGTPEEELRSDAAVTLLDGIDIPKGLDEHHFPAGRFAKVVHKGPYEGLGGTWSRFLEKLANDGHTLRDAPCYDVYLNMPGQVSEDELRTELYVPIE